MYSFLVKVLNIAGITCDSGRARLGFSYLKIVYVFYIFTIDKKALLCFLSVVEQTNTSEIPAHLVLPSSANSCSA